MIRNIFMFWPRFFNEARITRKYYKAVKEIEPELNKLSLRVDWIGRIYGVVKLKKEYLQQPDVIQQSMVFQELGPVNEILMKNGLSDLSYPEISKIPGTGQYLVVLYPENDHFNTWAFLRNFLFLGLLTGAGFGIAHLVNTFL